MPATGEAVLRVDRVGMTANNVTYALLGDAMHYWDFFPTRPGWGLVPLWGFGDVVASATEGVEVGQPRLRVLPVGEPPGRAPGPRRRPWLPRRERAPGRAAVAVQQLRAHDDRRRVRAPTGKTC